ncbi:MAG: type II toxin-antitoxin system RelE/ParE family toxin [Acidimicrobiales bacterium]
MTVAYLRPLAEQDLVERTRYYRDEGGDELGERFFEGAIASLRALERMPSIGSPRIGELCDIPGLRSYRIEGFPTGWFYLVRAEHIDVVRLLAYAQDLSAILSVE